MFSMKKNIVVILVVGSSVLALSTLRAQDAKFAADSSRDSRSFTEALAEARRLGETEEGKAYDEEFAKIAAPRLSDAVSECTKNLRSEEHTSELQSLTNLVCRLLLEK